MNSFEGSYSQQWIYSSYVDPGCRFFPQLTLIQVSLSFIFIFKVWLLCCLSVEWGMCNPAVEWGISLLQSVMCITGWFLSPSFLISIAHLLSWWSLTFQTVSSLTLISFLFWDEVSFSPGWPWTWESPAITTQVMDDKRALSYQVNPALGNKHRSSCTLDNHWALASIPLILKFFSKFTFKLDSPGTETAS